MHNKNINKLLLDVREGRVSVDEAALELKKAPFEEMEFATIDTHRKLRQGYGEVIYGEGKSAEQIIEICEKMISHGQSNILITRLSEDKASMLNKSYDIEYNDLGRIALIGKKPTPEKFPDRDSSAA